MYKLVLSDYEKVRDFTIQAGGGSESGDENSVCTDQPRPLNEQETKFLLRMCLSELQELALTVTDTVEQSVELLHECMKTIDKSAHEPLHTEDEIIAAQADAVVDAWYYSCNAFAKKSVDISKVFNVVHDANMAKRDPKTKKFIKREDGKIIKPEGWAAPDITAEITRQRRVMTDKIEIKKYTKVIDETVSNDRCNEYVKRISKSTIEGLIRKGVIELPKMEVNVDKLNGQAEVTFVWEDRLKYCVHNSGETSLLDLVDLKILSRGFSSDNAEKEVFRWLESYKSRKPSLTESSKMMEEIKLKDMK
jgi:predicted HAD superfamily Cof-like phosphohydrolase